MGRFLSVDRLLNSGCPDGPQTWNRYPYVNGNPLRFIDPPGLWRFAGVDFFLRVPNLHAAPESGAYDVPCGQGVFRGNISAGSVSAWTGEPRNP